MLTVGIGANVAVFSLFSSIVLEPLPYPEAETLVSFSSAHQARALRIDALSLADFRDLRQRTSSYTALAAYRPDFTSYVPSAGDPVQLVCGKVTEEFFAVFAIPPARGRTFRREEFVTGAGPVAVLSHAAWKRHFAANEDIVGRTLLLDEVPTTVVGIMPEGFREPEFAEVWLPFPEDAPENLIRDSRFWWTVGRPKPDRHPGTLAAEAGTVAAALAQEYPATNRGWELGLQPLREARVAGVRGSLLLLTAAVGLVLLVVCINLANLLLARGARQGAELAVRLALGATPGALARGVMLESLIVSALGTLAGVGFAHGALRLLALQLPAGLIPRSHEIGVHGTALLFAGGLAVLTALAFGLLPAWQVVRANMHEVLKAGGARGSTRYTGRAQNGLIAGQVALTIVVLAGATLLVRTLINLQHADLGFDPAGVVTLRISPPAARWQTFTELSAYYERVLSELRREPGVAAVALNSSTPLTGITLRYPFAVEGRPSDVGGADEAVFNAVSEDYFQLLRIPRRRGRGFEAADDHRSRPVCIINQSLAQRLFGDRDPIGQRLRMLPWMVREYREIVGVVADVKQESAADLPTGQVYVPQKQSPWFFTTLLVRGSGAGLGALQSAVRRADPTLTMTVVTLEDAAARSATEPRLRALLFAAFAGAALLISAFGMYASVSFAVGQRTREIGVRMALGAGPGEIRRWILVRAATVAATGALAGLAATLAGTRVLQGVLYGISPYDPLVLGGLTLFVPVVVVASAWWPAAQGARLSPKRALQAE